MGDTGALHLILPFTLMCDVATTVMQEHEIEPSLWFGYWRGCKVYSALPVEEADIIKQSWRFSRVA